MIRNPWQATVMALTGAALVLGGSVEAKPGKGGKDKGGGPPAHAGAAKAKGKKGGTPPGQAKKKAKAALTPARVDRGASKAGKAKPKRPEIEIYRDRDRQRVLDYFAGQRQHPHGLPPGLAKKVRQGRPLPPGWRKKLEPGWVVADDWWPRFEPLPYGWFPDLPVIPDTGLYLYGDRVVRIYEPRREVLDVIVVPTIHLDL